MRHVNLIGVDVSESSIKVLQLDSSNTITAYGSATLPQSVVVKGRILDEEAFSDALNKILKETKPNILHSENNILRAVLCLPESKLFSHYCIVPETISQNEIREYICTEAQKIIPFEIDDLYWNYHVVEKNGVRNATFISVEKANLDNYIKAFSYAKIRPKFVGGELFALGRALLPDTLLDEDYIILDIGAHSTTIGMFSNDAVPNDSILVPQGGEYFTQFLAEKLGVPVEEAERMKREYGIDASHERTHVPEALRESLSSLIKKIAEAKSYFERKTGNSIAHIILAGGSALIPHLDIFISEKLGVKTTIANPLSKIKGYELFEKDVPAIFFANVIGLALSATHSDFLDINLLTQYRKDEHDTADEHLAVRDVRSLNDLSLVSNNFMRKGRVSIKNFLNNIKRKMPKVHINLKLSVTILLLLTAISILIWVITKYM
ncbi:MAG: pilus assembly protein PilM [Minisyncoccia bacterium]